MRQLVYYVAVSLDGHIASPHDTFEMFPQQGDHIDMILRDWTDTIPAVGLEALGLEADRSRFDAVLMGWNTYAAGLGTTDDPYPHLQQTVFSRSAPSRTVPAGITLTDEDPAAVAARLKSEDGGDIWLCGGGLLASSLRDEIDRLVLKVNPVVLGAGKPLFDGAGYDPRTFTLTASTPYASGVVINEYDRAA
ncbi:riboflavin biosynthesis protein RibD [Aeromicrobium sp. Root495]|uniref:dihydrofolate reductase family protein n=1 Tax=Aeromicrobium sp. Root495 TaxID=1736550 RepID=UPI0006F61A8F|nr:dihydrofolate reductase family protein [Aeromicrobium sp. Root495]KQY59859.1 riboflavin biosynthesis protein RibD [Aeromicrobium sp. Root495]